MAAADPIERLTRLLVDLGAPAATATPVAGAVVADMDGPGRRYHTLTHVEAVLDEIDRLLPHEPAADREAVRLAAWYHDVVYDPTVGGGRNEADSAERARRELGALELAEPLAAEVDRLVRLTVGHRVDAADRSGAVLVDADLAILAADVEVYDRYAAAVRDEYGHVPDEFWRVGRADVLRSFLDQLDECFTAGPAADRDRRRAAAGTNLGRELRALDGSDVGPAS